VGQPPSARPRQKKGAGESWWFGLDTLGVRCTYNPFIADSIERRDTDVVADW